MAFVSLVKRLSGLGGIALSSGAGVGGVLLAFNLLHLHGLVDDELFPSLVWRICCIGLVVGGGVTIILHLWTSQPMVKRGVRVSLAIGILAGAVAGLCGKPYVYFAKSHDGRFRCFVSFYEKPAPSAEWIEIVNAAAEKAEKHPRPEWQDADGRRFWIPYQYSYRRFPVPVVILTHVMIGFVPFWLFSLLLARKSHGGKSD